MCLKRRLIALKKPCDYYRSKVVIITRFYNATLSRKRI
ncbi:hypothetical protein JCM19298_2798 [Nonlabens ulvanivorans]|nr:hypothetical protein JCM19297_1005 [Nonlabens ulvanivorans]GAK92310.1 hypothetical protein JCM19298_2798 [Nonlabens ulvanivorans]